MAIAVVNTKAGTFGSTWGTTGTVDTSGANLLVVGINYHRSFVGATPLSDSKGNTWTLIDTSDTGLGAICRLYYCTPGGNVGTGHTFSTTTGFSNIFAIAFSGARTASTPLDQQNKGANNTASVATGSITPSANDCVVVTVYGGFNPGAAPTMTSGGGSFTVPTGFSIATSTSESGAESYSIQTTATAANVTWTSAGSVHSSAIIASFFAPAAAWGTTNPAFLLNFV